MTPDLERAALAITRLAPTFREAMRPVNLTVDYVAAALRALRDPSPPLSPAVVEVMTRRLHEVNQSLGLWDEPLTRSRCREMALATWRAGIDAILESEP